jgi:hypothetical protein
MSIVYLQQVLKKRSGRATIDAIIVSSALFDALFQAADLRPRRFEWPAPRDPACRKVIDAWLKVENLPPSKHLIGISWHLVWCRGVRVVRDQDVGLVLAAEGPGSFEIVDGVSAEVAT